MAEFFLGEIKMFGGNFAPAGFSFCNGALLAISQNQALFALLGTTYGGDGVNTFALPDLRGRIPLGLGQGPGLTNRPQGEKAGVENVTLAANQMPIHNHPPKCSPNAGDSTTPAGNFWAANANAAQAQYAAAANANMNAGTVSQIGGNQPHSNLMPFLAINFIIALNGIFPSRN